MAFSFEKHPVIGSIATGVIAWQAVRFGFDFIDYASAAAQVKQNEKTGLVYPYESATLEARMQDRVGDAADALIFGGIAGTALYFATKEPDTAPLPPQ